MDDRPGQRDRLWERLPTRFRQGLLVAVATALIGWSAAWSQTPPPMRGQTSPRPGQVRNSAPESAKERLREGTELNEVRGYFRFVDDRIVFFGVNGDLRFTGLENLNLERIVAEITNNPTQLEWTVVGTVTEFRGTNYILVRRAVLSQSTSEFKGLPSQAKPVRP